MKNPLAPLLMRIINGFCLLSMLVLASGCATVTRGTKEVLVIESNPPGAHVELSNNMNGKTPAAFELPRKESLTVEITKPGYEPITVNVVPGASGAGAAGMAGNVLVGGLIGAGIDSVSGATLSLKPNPISVTLVPLDVDNSSAIEKSDDAETNNNE